MAVNRFGKQLAALRKARGLSQRALAARINVSVGTIGRYEQGRRVPDADIRRRLAAVLNAGPAERLWASPPFTDLDGAMMAAALALAAEAAADGEVPVGCVIARNGEIVGRGRNRRESRRSALAHAELEAIGEACRNLGGWRLSDCTLYVTLEPCPMCAGAILNARIPRVVYGAEDPKAGACGSVCDLFCMAFNHHPDVRSGLQADSCAGILREFFQKLRQRRG